MKLLLFAACHQPGHLVRISTREEVIDNVDRETIVGYLGRQEHLGILSYFQPVRPMEECGPSP